MKLIFSDQIDFFHFLSQAIEQVKDVEVSAELKFARLLILRRSLAEKQHNPPGFEGWVKEQQSSIYYSEPAGEWLVSPDLFWNLQAEYRLLPIAGDIAWETANNPLGGKCEGYLPCHLSRINSTYGRYLALYPGGKHAANALNTIAEHFKGFTEQLDYEYDRSAYLILQQELTQLRPTAEKTSAADKNTVLEQLERIAKLHLKRN